MAKGVEDTAFYRYGRFLALNDVGGDPSRFGIPVGRFHEANAIRAAAWPTAMLTLQTHDTKRSADVRARLAALSWVPREWEALARAVFAEDPPPDPAEGWLFLQTVVAAPVEQDRLRAYVEKALRERKLTSSWAEPDEAHERATADWTVRVAARDDVATFAERLAGPGRAIALGQKLLQLTAPGVPDVYQGDETELLALVDPDNRRPVDWTSLRTTSPSPKLALTRAALAVRGRHDLVGAAYEPLDWGPDVVAYLRGKDVLVAVPVRIAGEGRILEVPGRWRDALSGEELDTQIPLTGPRLLERV
jgi:(1->4)-alpha-D-glucan 1-alpha-D-glucosylmutase